MRLKEQSDEVGAILVDLSQRETQSLSEQFAGLILREGRGVIPFKAEAAQSAAFIVLKSPDVPSVLFETGYINNPADMERLSSPTGRGVFAVTLAQAIKVFFARTSPAQRG